MEGAVPAARTGFDLRADLARLGELYAAMTVVLALDEARLRRAAPSLSAWSALHHLAHVALADDLCTRNLHSLARGAGVLVRPGLAPVERALAILRSGRLPRGEVQSPRIVRPPEDVESALVRGWHADNVAALDALAPQLAQPPPADLWIPHQTLGPLDLAGWMRFTAAHTRHHLAIACEVLAADAGDAFAAPELPEL